METEEITFESVEPLVVNREFDRNEVACTFECPVTGRQFRGEGTVDREHDMQTRVQTSFVRRMGYRIARFLGDIVHSLTGSRILEEIADSLAHETAEVVEEESGMTFSDEAKRDAVLQAFEEVRNEFVWDAETEQWIARE